MFPGTPAQGGLPDSAADVGARSEPVHQPAEPGPPLKGPTTQLVIQPP